MRTRGVHEGGQFTGQFQPLLILSTPWRHVPFSFCWRPDLVDPPDERVATRRQAKSYSVGNVCGFRPEAS
jgi:hypothetical protein